MAAIKPKARRGGERPGSCRAHQTKAVFETAISGWDGHYVETPVLAGIAFELCLQREGARWRVIVDLNRSDVPEAAEVQLIKRQLPAGFPLSFFTPPGV